MKITTTLTAAALLALAPSLASAMGCNWGKHGTEQAMSCAEGSAFDAESGTCKPIATS